MLLFVTVVTRDLGEVFFGLLSSTLLEVVLPSVAGIPELDLLCLRFSF